jgi:hypothetical protein
MDRDTLFKFEVLCVLGLICISIAVLFYDHNNNGLIITGAVIAWMAQKEFRFFFLSREKSGPKADQSSGGSSPSD